MVVLGDARTKHIEPLVRKLCYGKVADQLAVRIKHGRKHDATSGGHSIRQQPLQPRFGAGAGNLIFSVGRDLPQPHGAADGAAFLSDPGVGGGAPERHILPCLAALRREPQRMLEPERGAEYRAALLESVVDW